MTFDVGSLTGRIEAAFVYGYPLFVLAQTRYRAVQDPRNVQRHAPNTVQHLRALGDHRSRWLTAPNNDTLYSNAWLDLSRGPVRIRVGQMPPGRYWSVALLDACTNHIAVVGQRLDARGPVDLTLVGPGQAAPGGEGRVIATPGMDVWLFARGLVDGPDDLARSHAMQDALEVLAPGDVDGPARVAPLDVTDPQNFLAVVNEALARNPPPPGEGELLSSWAEIGFSPGDVRAWEKLPFDAQRAWSAQIASAFEGVRRSGASGRRDFQGSIAAAADIGNFGRNFALRASVAMGGLGALEPDEAMYFVRYHDDDRQPMDGESRYVLHVPAGGIPTDSFWSFTMYEATADGRRFFVDNPIGRYSIGNRTAGLVVAADGSIEIVLQRTSPGEPQLRANWLPTPAGPFQIALRCYAPRAELREGRVAMPGIVRVDA